MGHGNGVIVTEVYLLSATVSCK